MKPRHFEIAITDFCNLRCKLCSQGTPLQKDKQTISLKQIESIGSLIKPYEFEIIKISGGEPTLHPEFGEICRNLKKWFPAKKYELATNGANLLRYKEECRVFDQIYLSLYPGQNDKIYNSLLAEDFQNLWPLEKRDYEELLDVHSVSNSDKSFIYEHCELSSTLKVVGNRIYKCCVIFGQSVYKDLRKEQISVLADTNWRQSLASINIESYCRNCFVDVLAPKTEGLSEEFTNYREKIIQKAEKHILQNELELAKEVLELLLSIDNNNIEALNNLAVLFSLMKQTDEAEIIFGRILEIDSDNNIALENLKALILNCKSN